VTQANAVEHDGPEAFVDVALLQPSDAIKDDVLKRDEELKIDRGDPDEISGVSPLAERQTNSGSLSEVSDSGRSSKPDLVASITERPSNLPGLEPVLVGSSSSQSGSFSFCIV